MISGEGLSLRRPDWYGAGLTLREASRLRRMAAADGNDPGETLISWVLTKKSTSSAY
jgi:hypothetical protein